MTPKKFFPLLLLLPVAAIAVIVAILTHGHSFAVLAPAGEVATRERTLILISTILMLVVVIPVYFLTFTIAWKYRADGGKSAYTPDWDRDSRLEFAWWAFPCLIIGILAVITWNASHQLDPYRALDSATQPMTIQVVALPWKWLFIYPDHHIATVNYLEFPEHTPITFLITADAPMNSFWIPQLGGQIYAMPGMSTQLHLEASGVGNYQGVSANLSGAGFAGMRFTAKSVSSADFDRWLSTVDRSPSYLNQAEYTSLAQPSSNDPVAYFSGTQSDLYNSIVLKYMVPAGNNQ